MIPRRIDVLSDLSKLALLSAGEGLPFLDPPLIAIVNGLDRGLGVRRELLAGEILFLVLIGGLGTAAAAAADGDEDVATESLVASSSL